MELGFFAFLSLVSTSDREIGGRVSIVVLVGWRGWNESVILVKYSETSVPACSWDRRGNRSDTSQADGEALEAIARTALK